MELFLADLFVWQNYHQICLNWMLTSAISNIVIFGIGLYKERKKEKKGKKQTNKQKKNKQTNDNVRID